MDIKEYSTEELQQEIDRRSNEPILPRPNTQNEIAWHSVITNCERYINDLDENGWVDDDFDHYIFEAAMTAVFGGDVWEWINSKLKS